MTRDEDLLRMAKEAGLTDPDLNDWMIDYGDAEGAIKKFADLVAASERERIAAEFDRRAVLSDGGPACGWYEPDEPAQIIRAMGDEPRQESEIYTPPPPTPEQLRINEMKRSILSRLSP